MFLYLIFFIDGLQVLCFFLSLGNGSSENPPELPPRLQQPNSTIGSRLSSNSNFELCTNRLDIEQGLLIGKKKYNKKQQQPN